MVFSSSDQILSCIFVLQTTTDKTIDSDEGAPQLPPLYISEFVLEPNQLLFQPDEEEFQEGVGEVIKRFQDCVLSVMNLVPDTYFDAFTRYDPCCFHGH